MPSTISAESSYRDKFIQERSVKDPLVKCNDFLIYTEQTQNVFENVISEKHCQFELTGREKGSNEGRLLDFQNSAGRKRTMVAARLLALESTPR